MRKMREDAEGEEMENGELNLVPYLDIVTNVIMFLMMTTTFAAALGSINVSSPTILPPGPVPTTQKVERHLDLTLQISDQGYTIATTDGVLGAGGVPGKIPTIPKRGAEFDNAELVRQMRQIKDQEPDETKVIINADPMIPYEQVVGAMDSIRQDRGAALFPDVALSTGVK
jgi:biopolymer transport protein ExbD